MSFIYLLSGLATQFLCQSVIQLVSQSVSQSVSQLVDLSFNQLVDLLGSDQLKNGVVFVSLIRKLVNFALGHLFSDSNVNIRIFSQLVQESFCQLMS